TYDSWHFKALLFDGELCLATAGTPTPNLDLAGKTLQVLHDSAAAVQHLHLTVVDFAGSGVLVVFGWRNENPAPRQFVDSLLSLSHELLGSYATQYAFAHLENIYFASSWWHALTEEQRLHVTRLAANSNPYYFHPTYSDDVLVP